MSSPNLAALQTEELPRAAGWRPLLRAASLTGAASVASAALSMLAIKIFAAMLGPPEVAVLATLQQIRQAGVTGATLNGQTVLVQGLSARSGRQRREFLRTAVVLMGTATAVVAMLALLAPGWIAARTGLGAPRAELIPGMIAPVALSCGFVFLSAVLNARGAIGRLALVQIAAPAAMAVLAYPVARTIRDGHVGNGNVLHGNDAVLVWWLAAAAAGAMLPAGVAFHRSVPAEWFQGTGSWWNRDAARRFLAMAGTMLAGGAAASLVLLAARARILDQQGFAVAGQFDAAWAISMGHVSLVLGSLQTYCLPALARTSRRDERGAHLTRMLTGAALAAAVVVCALAVLKPVVLALFYSDAFREAARFLRWTLIGDYLKVSSWVLSIPMLAAADMRAFLAADLSAYALFAAGAVALGHFCGAADGTAMAFVLMYAGHLAVCGSIAWRRYEFRPAGRTVWIWAAGLVAVLAVSAATWESA